MEDGIVEDGGGVGGEGEVEDPEAASRVIRAFGAAPAARHAAAGDGHDGDGGNYAWPRPLVTAGAQDAPGGSTAPRGRAQAQVEVEAALEAPGKSTAPRASSAEAAVAAGAGALSGPGDGPRVALLTWQCCQRHLLSWEALDRVLRLQREEDEGEAEGGRVGAPAVADSSADGDGGDDDGLTAPGPQQARSRRRFLTGVLSPFLAAWRVESPRGMLLGDLLAVAVAAGMAVTAAVATAAVPPVPTRGPEAVEAVGVAGAAQQSPGWSDDRAGTTVVAGGGGGCEGGSGGGGGGCRGWGSLALSCETALCSVELRGERRGRSLLTGLPGGVGAGAAEDGTVEDGGKRGDSLAGGASVALLRRLSDPALEELVVRALGGSEERRRVGEC
ncbi:hypothetical protein GPECTOR_90g516 [Gonium pectorale]|uniref:Uncharacterized protein n=1 Tax=Gonium pectorale TaxID=33097 RepID=A0A150G2A0_GONPE|nr:hypothetical protein GPECTOR_90g516 [Gonium pectorale]|eukprot:KXZ43430.1 hypothetical protein GPECTOR_90g516 [Gonium pectorale]